jgi:hypothetical protein
MGCLFFFVSRGDGDGHCERRVETGASREDRVCDGQLDRQEWGKSEWAKEARKDRNTFGSVKSIFALNCSHLLPNINGPVGAYSIAQ